MGIFSGTFERCVRVPDRGQRLRVLCQVAGRAFALGNTAGRALTASRGPQPCVQSRDPPCPVAVQVASTVDPGRHVPIVGFGGPVARGGLGMSLHGGSASHLTRVSGCDLAGQQTGQIRGARSIRNPPAAIRSGAFGRCRTLLAPPNATARPPPGAFSPRGAQGSSATPSERLPCHNPASPPTSSSRPLYNVT